MTRTLILTLALIALTSCETFAPKDDPGPDSDLLRESVKAPFRDMICKSTQIDREIGAVHFSFEDASLTEDAQTELNQLAETLRNEEGTVIVEGHTDHVNSEVYNVRLGYRRAVAVAEHLKSAGIWDDRIVVKSCGENRPVQTNWFEEGRAENRRVVIRLRSGQEEMTGKEAVAVGKRLYQPACPAKEGTTLNLDLGSLLGQGGESGK